MQFMKKKFIGFLKTFETESFEGSNLRKSQVNWWFFKGASQNSNEQDSKIIIRK
jgi:hypothetical protein